MTGRDQRTLCALLGGAYAPHRLTDRRLSRLVRGAVGAGLGAPLRDALGRAGALGSLTAEDAAGLEAARVHTAGANLQKLAVLRRALAALDRAGVRVAVLKGSVLLGDVWPVDARALGDCDLLVDPTAQARATAALRDLGFRRAPAPERHGRPWHPAHYHGEPLLGPDGLTEVEIHEALGFRAGPASRDRWTVARALDRAIPAPHVAPTALRLRPEDELLHLCVHPAQHLYEGTLVQLLDLHRRCGAAGGDADWDRVLDGARDAGNEVPAALSLRLASALLGTSLPAATTERARRLAPDSAVRLLAALVSPLLVKGDERSCFPPRWRRQAAVAALIDGLRRGAAGRAGARALLTLVGPVDRATRMVEHEEPAGPTGASLAPAPAPSRSPR